MKKVFFLFISSLFILNTALAYDPFQIIAKVNDEVITEQDYLNNKNFSVMNNKDQKAESHDNIVSDLILDKVRKIQADKNKIVVSQEELDNVLSQITKEKKTNLADLKKQLKKYNIDYNFYVEKIKSEILWQKLIEKEVIPKIFISDHEVNEMLEFLVENPYKTKYDVSEISIYVNNSNGIDTANTTINKIYNEIIKNNDFEKMAKNFSESTTAKDGGALGWIDENDLSKEIIEKIKFLGQDQVTEPFFIGDSTSGVYFIFKLNDKKTEMLTPDDKTAYKIREFLYRKKLRTAVNDYINSLYNNVLIERY